MNETTPRRLGLSLRAVYVRSSQNKMAAAFVPTVGGVSMAGQFRVQPCTEPKIVDDSGIPGFKAVVFMTKFEFRYAKAESATTNDQTDFLDNDFLANIEVDIDVEYLLEPNSHVTPTEYKVWAESSVLTQAWPYWREYCQSMMARMGLPVMIVPLLQMEPASEDSAQQFVAQVAKERAAEQSRKKKLTKIAK